MPGLEDAITYCQDARDILKTKGLFSDLFSRFGANENEESKKANAAFTNVVDKLNDLKKKNLQDYGILTGEFSNVSELLGKDIQTNDKSLGLTLIAQLVHLGNCIDDKLGAQVNLRDSLATLTRAVDGIYAAELIVAKKKADELKNKNTQQPAHTLYGGAFNFDGTIPTRITNAEFVATPNPTDPPEQRPKSVTNGIKWLAGVEKEHSKGLKLHTDYEAYKAKMDQAEAHRRELFLLSTGIKDYSETFTDAMNAARRTAVAPAPNGSPHDFKEADAGLTSVIATYNELKSAAKAAKEKALLEAEQKPVYEDKVRRINNDIRELKKHPGTKSAVDKLEKSLQDSEVHKNAGDFKLAREELKGSTEAYKNGKAAADNSYKTMDPSYKLKLVEARNKLSEVERLVGRSQFETIATYRKGIHDSEIALSNASPPSNVSTVLATEKNKITDIITALSRIATSQQGKHDTCVTSKNLASTEMEEFQSLYLINNYKVLPLFRQAESEFAVDNYDEAKRLYEGVTTTLATLKQLPENEPAYISWGDIKNDRAFSSQLESLAKVRSENCHSLKQFALLESTTTALLENLSQNRDYRAAVAIAPRVTAAAPVIEDILSKYYSTESKRKELINPTKAAVDAATLKISELATKSGDVKPFENDLNTFKNEWEHVRSGNDFENEQALDNAFNEFKTKLAEKIVDPIGAMLSAYDSNLALQPDPNVTANQLRDDEKAALEALKQSIKDAKTSETKKEFETKLSRISATIMSMKKDALAYNSLQSRGTPLPPIAHPVISNATTKLDDIRKRVQNALSENPLPDFTFLRDAVAVLEAELTAVFVELDRLRVAKRVEANNKIEECLAIVTTLMTVNLKFAPYFKPFTGRVGDLKAMADSKIWTTVDQCAEAATAWQLELTRTTPPALTQSFTAIQTVLVNIQKGLVNENLMTHLPERLKALNMRFQTIEQNLYKEGPVGSAANAAVEFLKEVNTAVSAAADAGAARLEITRLANLCTLALVNMTDAPSQKESFEAMITSASKPAEGSEIFARQRLEVIKIQIDQLNLPESAGVRLEMEQSKAVQKNTEDLRKKEFDKALDVFKKKLFIEAQTLMNSTMPNHNSDLYNKITELQKDAETMSKQKFIDTAIEKLDAARTAAHQFLKNPLSIQVNARNKLTKVGDDWLKTISTFVKSMNELKAAVKTSMEDENIGKTTQTFGADSFIAMEKPLTEAARSFDANKFTNYIREMVDNPTKVKEYREAKEDALRFVRAYQTIVNDDPVLLSAASNPFGVVVSLSSVKEALRVLELNLRSA